MGFTDAKSFPAPGGEFSGMSIDRIAFSDYGLAYLDAVSSSPPDWATTDFVRMINVYLSDKSIKKDLLQIDTSKFDFEDI